MYILSLKQQLVYFIVFQLGMKRSASDSTVASSVSGNGSTEGGLKRQRSQPQVADPTWPLDKQHADSIINFLIRLACQVMATGGQSELFSTLFIQSNDTQVTNVPGSPPTSGEALSKRCVSLIRTALKPDLWPSKTQQNIYVMYLVIVALISGIDVKLSWFGKLLETIVSNSMLVM